LTPQFSHATFLAYASFSAQAGARRVILTGLSRRERQIMEILYRRGKGSASDVREAMPDAPTYSTVRALLRVLEGKGHVEHQNEGLKYVYLPLVKRDKAKRSAVKHLVDTFFRDAPEQVVAALLDVSSKRLTNEELDRMAAMIEKAKKEGR
jgi:BlaI family penicillinase repressor